MHLNDVQTQSARHGVNVAVQRKLHLRAPKTAKCTVRWVVGVDQRGVRVHVLQPVHVVAAHGAHMHHLGRQSAVGPALSDDAHVFGNDDATRVHANLQRDALGQTGAACQKVFEPVVDEPHRLACSQCQPGSDQVVGVLNHLAAKAAAGSGLNHADLRDRHLQHGGQARSHQKGGLG